MPSTFERRQEIVLQTQKQGKVVVADLARQYNVSTVTIRNDLNDLGRNGFLVRCRGGAMASSKLAQELSVQEKYSEHHFVKMRLGQAVADLVVDGDSIIIDSGTTTEEVAHCLLGHKRLTVMTNGLNIANELAKNESVEMRITGGKLRKKSMSFYGRQAEDGLRHLNFDKVILGVDGFDLSAGISTYFEHEATLNRLMCDVSSEIIAVTDSSKFDQCGFHLIRPYSAISILVTDKGIPEAYAKALADSGVKVILVDE